MKKIISLSGLTLLLAMPIAAQTAAPDSATTMKEQTLANVTITSRKATTRSLKGAINGKEILRDELFKAACCNLGESFVTNPSVDVNYSDATTGAKQVKLLGLSGTYVQMLTENLPNFRGAALPYGLGYVPGSWMKSMQVSKGNSSVKNGYEAITGQINVEYVKPEDDKGLSINLYGSTMGKFEANADGNLHINGDKNLSTEILAHVENNWSHHDGNSDGFQDDPQIKQYNLQNRWFWKRGNYILHTGLSLLKEDRTSGQTHKGQALFGGLSPYRIEINTNRYEGYMKHALILNAAHGTNLAFMGNVSLHQQDARYGIKEYDVNEKNAYASLIFETDFTPSHNLSAGLSLNHDALRQSLSLPQGVVPSVYGNLYPIERALESETTPGAYVQYTYSMNHHFVAMAGLRVDHSNVYGTFFTPRFHLKWMPSDLLTIRLSAGKGYRSPHALAENNYLMASGRRLIIDDLRQEAAWNYGTSLSFLIPVGRQTLKLNADYYYTHFLEQTIVDYDTRPDELHITHLDGKSYSHTVQVDASYLLFNALELTAAYRYNLVKATYGGQLRWKPLQSRYKGLLTLSYKTPLGLWQFDATAVLNGGGRLPEPYTTPLGNPSWERHFSAYGQLNAQITRYFRHFSVYIGGENLTNYKQKNPIVGYNNPWGRAFEPTMIYAPVQGAMGYVGIRMNLGKRL
ncbi:TonB-dependent receptor [Prevotella sp. oral taxon 475]|uniref:TonB-dependent receptor plug domain-containing protein n=1 Tax=Prevotella sp. oral taxon 475 TaxID=712471 RepID=UPI001BA932BA|nr:TonB-dependent receptor [Prevotella sp. oral taxon 475]QUB47669.1 TonB-dependent receptor [Prevotella sp. oral taxon 475]